MERRVELEAGTKRKVVEVKKTLFSKPFELFDVSAIDLHMKLFLLFFSLRHLNGSSNAPINRFLSSLHPSTRTHKGRQCAPE